MEQLEWSLLPAGTLSDWDEMIHWFVEQIERDQSILRDSYIKRWFNAAEGMI
jgi:hypothetical protein